MHCMWRKPTNKARTTTVILRRSAMRYSSITDGVTVVVAGIAAAVVVVVVVHVSLQSSFVYAFVLRLWIRSRPSTLRGSSSQCLRPHQRPTDEGRRTPDVGRIDAGRRTQDAERRQWPKQGPNEGQRPTQRTGTGRRRRTASELRLLLKSEF